jgi:Organic solute transporter Ostalpha
MILELNGLYKEGDFSLSSGYLYICFLTNFSQCWALYCLIFFYLATKNELGPIRPVGKFLSVKALVFFTWWQSLFISLIYQMDLIPHYHASNESEWTSEDVAKGLQDYLICIEMFVGAIVHVFVFPHTDYLPEAVQARRQSFHHMQRTHRRQLGRRHLHGTWSAMMRDDLSAASKNSGDVELASHATAETLDHLPSSSPQIDEEPNMLDMDPNSLEEIETDEDQLPDDSECSEFQSDHSEAPPKTGFVKALIDSTIPRDFIDQSVGIVKGDYMVEKKSLLNHAATSDQYDLFSSSRRFLTKATKHLEGKE